MSLSLDDHGLVTVDEAASMMEVSPSTIYVWRHRYGIRSVRREGRLLLSVQDLWRAEQLARSRDVSGRARRRSS